VWRANEAPLRPDGEFVLYWMIANRRLSLNFALDQATGLARELDKPLVILEALRAGYPWASDRLHRFALDGMAVHKTATDALPVTYYPYVEPEHGSGSGLLGTLAARACAVVTDDFPAFFLPGMVRKVGPRLPVRLDVVDANGLLPMRAASKAFTAAYHFRRFLQKTLPDHLMARPAADPLADVPRRRVDLGDVLEEWPAADPDLLAGGADALGRIAIDHEVAPVDARGGSEAGRARLEAWVREDLGRYGEARNDPDAGATSGLSPYLHWGQLSVHEIFDAVASAEGWNPGRLSDRTDGKRSGWWGMSDDAESFLDELVTWRELAFNTAAHVPGFDRYQTLPEWAQGTLADHAADPRPHLYPAHAFEAADTHDPLWNAAQRQLVTEGVIHGYLRMLWGKKILEWSASPEEALATMIHLNNRYAIDGRDPNSYGGIFWTLGRYDRGWPERAVYGKVRSMTSKSTRRKVNVDGYLRRFGPGGELELDL
jgi:deoxyribodipyrimidine photo-lyase